MLIRLPFKKKILLSIMLASVILTASILGFILSSPRDNNQNINPIFKGGTIAQDEAWSGNIFVNESILVPKGLH